MFKANWPSATVAVKADLLRKIMRRFSITNKFLSKCQTDVREYMLQLSEIAASEAPILYQELAALNDHPIYSSVLISNMMIFISLAYGNLSNEAQQHFSK